MTFASVLGGLKRKSNVLDTNLMTEQGIYYTQNYADMSHMPEALNGIIIVIGDNVSLRQIQLLCGYGAMWYRRNSDGGYEDSTWKKVSLLE